MKKQAIVTEIEDLLISINNHFIDVENNSRIPTIELDVIANKVNKLHEKITILKFVAENENLFNIHIEQKVDNNEKSNKIEELKNKAFTIVTPTELKPEVSTISMEKIELKPIEEVSKPIAVEVKSTEIEQSKPTNTVFVDLKKIMSINDKILFQNELFNKNATDFTHFIDIINAQSDFQNAIFQFNQFQKKLNWKVDDEHVLSIKQYIHKKFNS